MRRFNNQLKTVLLLGALSVLLIGFGSLFGPGTTWVFLGLALAMNIGAYFFSDRLVLRMHGARPIEAGEMPKLRAMVSELAGRAGLPTPRLFLIEAPYANAFATGRNPKHGVVAVTTGLLDLLEPREVRGVIAHELAHIKNRDILVATVAAAVATAVSYAAQAFTFQAFLGGNDSDEESAGDGAGGILALLVAPLIATLVQLGISRSREFLADETGARIAGDAEGLASALARLERGAEHMPLDEAPATASLFIVNPLAGLRVAHLFSTHPPMEERIRRLLELRRDPAYAA